MTMMGTSMDTQLVEWLAGLFPVLAPGTRRVTLLFTDIQGFSACAAARGDRAAARLLRRHDAATLPALRRHGGRIVKRLGDGLMVAFTSAPAALGAALAMQRAADARAVRLRIGIHTGTARPRAGDLIGHDVNVAARIADRAGGGEILVSEAVRMAGGRLPLVFRKARPVPITPGTLVPAFRVLAHEA
jgi:adenylate cyclase